MKKKISNIIFALTSGFIMLVILTPILYTVITPFRDGFKQGVEIYWKLAIWEPKIIHALTNSILISFSTSFGSLLLAFPAAFAFAKGRWHGRDGLFLLYVIAMILPFQITLLPQYILSQKLHLYNTIFAIIVPGIFSPFSVFLLAQNLKVMSDDVIEYAQLDTSSLLTILSRIVFPIMKPAVICTMVLSFSEAWNSVSEPLMFFELEELFPMSVLLHEIEMDDMIAFAAASVYMILPLLWFLIYHEEILKGMAAYKLK